MTQIRVQNFGGMIPRIEASALPANAAVDAINCDLTGRSIKSMYGLKDVAESGLGTGAGSNGNGLAQFPTPCLQVRPTYAGPSESYLYPYSPKAGFNWITAVQYPVGTPVINGGSSYTCLVYHTSGVFATDLAAGKWRLENTTITVVATDDLVCAVLLPATPTPIAGQGCIDILFSDGTTLSASLADQNGVIAKSGNIAAYATDRWYQRTIQLGGSLANNGTAITGKTIAAVSLKQEHSGGPSYKAHYGYIYVTNRSTGEHKQLIYDSDKNRGLDSIISAVIDDIVIDRDDAAMIYDYNGTGSEVAFVAPSAFAGTPKLKVMTAESDGGGSIESYSAHDVIYVLSLGSASRLMTWANLPPAPYVGYRVRGWAGVPTPSEALAAPTIVGGVATDVTRSYVYTNVSADGLESAPSPARIATGKPDGSWNFTGIPTWPGSDSFGVATAGRMLHQRRLYRTPVGSAIYRFVGTLDDNDTAFNDAVTDANLGAELSTTSYADAPQMQSVAQWYGGVVGAITKNGEVAFSARFAPHAWPLTQRYVVPNPPLGCESLGDRFIVLTVGAPVTYYGSDLENLVPVEITGADACIARAGITKSPLGVFYPGSSGWGLIAIGGYSNVSQAYLSAEQFPSYIGSGVVSMFDGRRLLWISRGATTGYSLEIGAEERAFVKFEVPYPLHAMSYYARRQNRWVTFDNSTAVKIGRLFGDTNTKYKWTWKSKLFRLRAPVSMAVAKVGSVEWASLSYAMRNRVNFYNGDNAAWVTATAYVVGDIRVQGGVTYTCIVNHTSGVFATDLAALRWQAAPYSITITGLTQSEGWCHLKVWADADDSTNKRLVYDDLVVNGSPVALIDDVKSDCWQFEIRGNIEVTSVTIATSEGELNLQEE